MVRQTFDHFRHVALQWPTSPMQTSTITNPSPLASITSGYRDSGQGREDQVKGKKISTVSGAAAGYNIALPMFPASKI